MKPSELQPGDKFRLPGQRLLFQVMSDPQPYIFGDDGDVVIEVKWIDARGRLRIDSLSFMGRVPVTLTDRTRDPHS